MRKLSTERIQVLPHVPPEPCQFEDALKGIVKEMNARRPADEQTTTQNISNKLSRGTIKYSEILEIADIIGYKIVWEKK